MASGVPPEFISDRALGKKVPELREAGFLVHTLPEIYGSEEAAQQAEDTDWIAKAGERGWGALTKDRNIRRITIEREALAVHRVPLFALANANLDLAQMAGAFLLAMPAIIRAVELNRDGSIWIVQRDGRVAQQWP